MALRGHELPDGVTAHLGLRGVLPLQFRELVGTGIDPGRGTRDHGSAHPAGKTRIKVNAPPGNPGGAGSIRCGGGDLRGARWQWEGRPAFRHAITPALLKSTAMRPAGAIRHPFPRPASRARAREASGSRGAGRGCADGRHSTTDVCQIRTQQRPLFRTSATLQLHSLLRPPPRPRPSSPAVPMHSEEVPQRIPCGAARAGPSPHAAGSLSPICAGGRHSIGGIPRSPLHRAPLGGQGKPDGLEDPEVTPDGPPAASDLAHQFRDGSSPTGGQDVEQPPLARQLITARHGEPSPSGRSHHQDSEDIPR